MVEEKTINIFEHELVPKHRILSEEEKQELFKKHGTELKELPRIYIKDPAVVAVGGKIHDVLEITRKSPTAGETKYYRVVISSR